MHVLVHILSLRKTLGLFTYGNVTVITYLIFNSILTGLRLMTLSPKEVTTQSHSQVKYVINMVEGRQLGHHLRQLSIDLSL